jgi:large subunit ribosomal protein L22
MGVRKRETADARKEANKSIAFAKLNNCPTSPRKMRLVADLVRGQKVERALNILRFSSKEASRKLEKLLLSAINNWEQKKIVKVILKRLDYLLKKSVLTVE